jgi:hypothetical protein
MIEINDSYRKKLGENLKDCLELTNLCIRLKKSYLKNKYPDLSEDDLERIIFSESIKIREQVWKQQIQ